MNENFTIENLKNFIDIYSYPMIVANEKNYPILLNSIFKRLDKSDYDSIQLNLNNALKTKEYIINRNNKNIFYTLNFSKIIIKNNNYKIISFNDITVRKGLMENLKEKQNLFNSLTEQLPEGIVLFKNNIIYTNDTFENLVGDSSRNLQQKRFIELFGEAEQSIFKDNLKKLLISRKSTIENRMKLIKFDNSIVDVKVKIKRIRQNDKNLFLALITNVTKEINQINKLSVLANFDKLTGIYNRRKFDELLEMEYKITKRYDRDLSAIFFDIDHFKRVNDTYGHDEGDFVLSNLSSLISKQIRETDIFARWGGEEFIILLPETTSEKAALIANEIMMSLSTFKFSKVGKITISIGISSMRKEHLQSFLKRLDKALYKAKIEGRNRYIVL
jgi:two-component system cell cycle response regulator